MFRLIPSGECRCHSARERRPETAGRCRVCVDRVKCRVANILSTLDLRSRAELGHWAGMRGNGSLDAKGIKMETQLVIGPIGQISRRVKDIAAARHWYGEVLGLEHLFSFGDLAFFDCGGVRLFLTEEGDDGGGESVLYFQVEDIRLTHVALQSAGVEFVDAPHMIHRHDDGTEEWMAFFRDNEGRPLALATQIRASPDMLVTDRPQRAAAIDRSSERKGPAPAPAPFSIAWP
ncbi:hypothetical protein CAP40_10240 [Sphingomonas sp. IBVSS2]|uniref:VOC family protein n=1 Tax=Sphingomonas sp. IBVSS2 TaxID=1985172 RepID=UPI000A2D98F6|nr:VOC family protein [Sphingomonas sp. IBVSS2]OSZ66280.1 hypothetical protein CAP40_10240 [Sphingomonas sp. IBVSS2]